VRGSILYVTHKVKGTLEKRKRNAMVFVRLFLIILRKISYKENGISKVKFGDILDIISKYSQFSLIAIAVFPLILPIPYPPGMPTMLSIPVFIFILNALVGRKIIKIPEKVRKLSFKIDSLKMVVVKSTIIVTILAKISRGGRLKWIIDPQMTKIHAFFMLIMCTLIALPFPGTNYLPSISIFVISLGVVLTDGILVGIGYFIGLSGILLVTMIVIFGKALLVFIINFAKYLSY
jgi:hypothetical protein